MNYWERDWAFPTISWSCPRRWCRVAGARELAQMLKVPVDEHGFFLEAHVKLRPLDFATDGVYLCGSAHWPAHLDEAISQAYGRSVAGGDHPVQGPDPRLWRGGSRGRVSLPGLRALRRGLRVWRHRLGGIGSQRQACANSRNHRAAAMVARVNPVLCKGCGACAVVCPTSAMQASHFTSRQVTAMIQAALGG